MAHKYPAPDRQHHKKFCTTEQWTLVANAKGKPITHHETYELPLHTGEILRTRISHPVNQSTYGASMWSFILSDQLAVTNDVFWACVQKEILPDRGAPTVVLPTKALPLFLLHQVVTLTGLSEKEALMLSPDEAKAKLAEYWANQ